MKILRGLDHGIGIAVCDVTRKRKRQENLVYDTAMRRPFQQRAVARTRPTTRTALLHYIHSRTLWPCLRHSQLGNYLEQSLLTEWGVTVTVSQLQDDMGTATQMWQSTFSLHILRVA